MHRVRQPLQRRQVHQHARKLLLRLLRRSQDGPRRLLVLGSGRVLHQQGHLQVRFFTFLSLPPSWWIFCLLKILVTLAHVNQMSSQPMHLTHELILCIQIIRGWVDF